MNRKIMTEILIPSKVWQTEDQKLGIRWPDGHESRYATGYLRGLCRCAVCVDEWTGKRLLDPDKISADIHPLHIESVGRYGLRIQWSDGHSTGIYTFQYLRKICPCADCVSK
jgi:DUF971 family protein